MERRPGKDSMGLRPMAQVMPSVLIPLSASSQRLLSGVGAESDSGVLYQHSVICQTCLPYRNPGDANRRWQAKNGFLTLEVEAGRAYDGRVGDFIDVGLPYGPKPRLVLYHLNAEALRTRSPVIELGDSLSAFVKRTLGLHAHGRNLHGVRDQLARLAAADFRIGTRDAVTSSTVQGRIFDGLTLWRPPTGPKRPLWPTEVEFSRNYFESLLQHAVPLNEAAVSRLSHSAMALDIYAWLAQRLHRIDSPKPVVVSWMSLSQQFGPGYAQVREFRRVFQRTLAQVRVVYPDARVQLSTLGMHLASSRPPVARRLLPLGISQVRSMSTGGANR